jgi:hypothetical protein
MVWELFLQEFRELPRSDGKTMVLNGITDIGIKQFMGSN